MFFLVTPNATVNAHHIDCVKWEVVHEPLAAENGFVAYVSFESGKKEKLVGADARALREKFDSLSHGEIQPQVVVLTVNGVVDDQRD